MENYLAAKSLTKEQFDEQKVHLSKSNDATLTSEYDVLKIENILDLSEGILKGQKFYTEKSKCNCGRLLSFYDFIFTALVEQWHSPSFLVHTLVGNKYFVNEARPLRCSECGSRMSTILPILVNIYETDKYGCCLK